MGTTVLRQLFYRFIKCQEPFRSFQVPFHALVKSRSTKERSEIAVSIRSEIAVLKNNFFALL
jgi:hypothetical protein